MSVFSRHFLSSCQFLHFPFAKTRKPQYKIYRRLEDSFIHLKFESMKVKKYRSIHTAPRHRSTSQWSPASYVEIAGATCKKNSLARQPVLPGAAWPLVQHGLVDQSGPPGGRKTGLKTESCTDSSGEDTKPCQRQCQKVWFLHSGHVNLKLPILASVQVAVTAPRFSEPSLPATMTFCEPGSQTFSST